MIVKFRKNNFFKEAVSTLDINENSYIINSDSINISNVIETAIRIYKSDRSIFIINGKVANQDKFSFKPISKLDMENEVQLINPKKATTSDGIPPKKLKISSEASADVLHNLFNGMLKSGTFPDNLKLAYITPVSKKKNYLHKVNYIQVSVLPSISQVFEELMQK